MKDKDYIKDLFNEKLNGFEVEVRPDLWANISSQIGSAASTTATTSLSIITKTIIGLSVAAVVSGVAFFALKDENASKTNIKAKESSAVIENKPTEELEQGNKEKPSEITNNTKVDRKNIDKKEKSEIVKTEEIIFPISITEIAPKLEKQSASSREETKLIIQLEKKELAKQSSVQTSEKPIKESSVIVSDVIESKIPEIVKEESIEDKSVGKLSNVFTPNGDNVNDFLSVESTGLTDFSIVVIDHNSKIVFQSTESNFRWDGYSMNGEITPAGNYVYYITARNSKGEFITKHSNLRIQR